MQQLQDFIALMKKLAKIAGVATAIGIKTGGRSTSCHLVILSA